MAGKVLGPGALLKFRLVLNLAGHPSSLLTVSAHGDEPGGSFPEGSRGVKVGLMALFVVTRGREVASEIVGIRLTSGFYPQIGSFFRAPPNHDVLRGGRAPLTAAP